VWHYTCKFFRNAWGEIRRCGNDRFGCFDSLGHKLVEAKYTIRCPYLVLVYAPTDAVSLGLFQYPLCRIFGYNVATSVAASRSQRYRRRTFHVVRPGKKLFKLGWLSTEFKSKVWIYFKLITD
jgi:hypothetical protein